MFDFCILVLENEIADPKNDESKVLMFAKGAEDMLAMINTFKFTQIMNSITNPRIKKQVVRLAAALTVVAANNKRWLELVKNLKVEYWNDAAEPATKSKELADYENINKEMFEIYLTSRKTPAVPPTPSSTS